MTSPFVGVTDYRLNVRLIALQQEFFNPISDIHLVLQATLIDNNTNRALATRRFQTLIQAPGNNPYSGVKATNTAAEILSEEIAKFVVGNL